tara:strand:+ start:12264 stop:13295 length:1032 start_codon:yes stop_codon:yes gene_type:complete
MEQLLRIDSEITNRCNAACPLCARTGTFGAGVSEVLFKGGYKDLPLDVVDNILNSDSALHLKKWSYCGNYGDPFMHPKVYDIADKVASKDIKQIFDTNGGMRDKVFWSEMGKFKSLEINFAIDGLSDTNEIYRVKTNFNKIMENTEAFIKAGGKANWVFIVFSHNEHQVEEAKKLSKDLGFRNFEYKISTRGFNFNVDGGKPPEKPRTKEIKVHKKIQTSNEITIPKEKKFRLNEIIHKEVNCKAIYQNQFFVTPDPWILPCCYVHAEVAKRTHGVYKKDAEFFEFMINNKVKYDMNEDSFDDIVTSYRDNLPQLRSHWKSRRITICNKICGSNRANKTIRYN